MRRSLPFALLATTLLGSCTGITNSAPGGTVRVIGFLQAPSAGMAVVAAPDTARAGVPFAAIVYSFGSSSCVHADGATIDATAAQVTVTPYDRVPADQGSICTADFGSHPHPVALLFTSPGVDTIVAWGYHINAQSQRVLTAFPRLIVVLP